MNSIFAPVPTLVLSVLATISLPSITYAQSTDAECIDTVPVGDGWGWDGSDSCTIPITNAIAGECIDTGPVNDGWGWDGIGSCTITVAAPTCVDTPPAGDGWGWDGITSCVIAVDQQQPSDCIDSDPIGDGWGWDGVASCVVDTSSPEEDENYQGIGSRLGQIWRVQRGDSIFPPWRTALSTDARFLFFGSWDPNLVDNDNNDVVDLFLKDTSNGNISRINVAQDGTDANNQSYYTAMSSDGRYLSFSSYATNLASGTTNGTEQIHRYDTDTGVMTLVSVNSNGEQGSGPSFEGQISDNGRFVAFGSAASNLVSNDGNGATDVFLHDADAGVTTRISANTEGNDSGSQSLLADMSPDGRFILFISDARDLVEGDINNAPDKLFLHDTATGTTSKISGAEGVKSAAVSDNGRYITWSVNHPTYRNNAIVSNYRVHWQDTTALYNNGFLVGSDFTDRYNADISPDGRYVVYESGNFGAKKILVTDMIGGTTTELSTSIQGTGTEADGSSEEPHFTADGKHVWFRSAASNLVENDTNGLEDVFAIQFLP